MWTGLLPIYWAEAGPGTWSCGNLGRDYSATGLPGANPTKLRISAIPQDFKDFLLKLLGAEGFMDHGGHPGLPELVHLRLPEKT